MDSKWFVKLILIHSLVLAFLWGCATPVRVVKEPPPFPEGFLSAKWGASVEEIKKAIAVDGNQWFKDQTDRSPYALYVSGSYLDSLAIFSYFFTPKSKKLYRVDLTFKDPAVFDKAKADLIQKLMGPSFAQNDLAHWSWNDKSLIILQRNPMNVQMSYSSGPFLIQNHKEGNGLTQ